MLSAVGYQGALKTFNRVDSAVKYLNRTVSENGMLIAADLLFFSFCIQKHNIIDVMNRFSAAVPQSDESIQDAKTHSRTFLKQNLVLCLDWNAIVMRSFVPDS